MSEDPKISVRVPTTEEFQMSPKLSAIWDVTGSIIYTSRKMAGDDMAFSMILSRVTRELRRTIGIEEAVKLLHGLADTMPEAAKYDAPVRDQPFSHKERMTIAEVFAQYGMSSTQEAAAWTAIERRWHGTIGRFYAYVVAHEIAASATHG